MACRTSTLTIPCCLKARRHDHALPSIIALVLTSVAAPGLAATDIAQSPLYLGGQVKPNIMMLIDDSGSMDSEVLLPANDGAAWWHSGDQSFVGRNQNDSISVGTINFNFTGDANSTWKKYTYLFPNGTGTGNRVYPDDSHNHYAIPPTAPYAWFRSPDYNGMYYDPHTTYTPWVSDGATVFNNANPAAAISDPKRGGSTMNLASNLAITSTNWVFRMHAGMVIPKGTQFRDTDNIWKTAASDILVSSTRNVPISYYPATYYLKTTTGTYVTSSSIGTCANPQPAHYLDFAQHPEDFISADGVHALGPDGSCMVRYEIKSGNTFPSGRSYAAEIQNFANWFSYYRKRHLSLRAGAGNSFDSIAGIRVGGFPINSRTTLNGMWDIDTQRNSFYQWMYGVVGSGGTPNREALKAAGDFFNTNANVITHSCQQNFTLLFTDGYSNVSTASGVGNADGDQGAPYADTASNTIADIAMYFYKNTLRAALNKGNVPIPQQCTDANPDPWLDCNEDLHMVTFGISLGAKGHIFGASHFSVEDGHNSPPTWLEPNLTRNPVQVDDLYHAALNSRGEMLNANNAEELESALTSALTNILYRGASSASAVATNSTRLDTDTFIYQAKYDTSDWSGHLLAFKINSDGSVGAQQWDAATRIPTPHTARNIFTHNGTTGVEFKDTQWDNMHVDQRTALGSTDILNYLRGDRSQEINNGGSFRNRTYLLGDIINSDPWYVGRANFGYSVLPDAEGDQYTDFISSTDIQQRSAIVYVGANDGMLHAFDAVSGTEKFAYVPSGIYANLTSLASPAYSHKYFVDGAPRAGDAYIDLGSGSQWHTVLLGSTGAGGRSVFALNVTDPDSFTADKVMWEFGYADAPCTAGVKACREIGYTIGQPTIARMQNGTWVAIFGNGFNSAGQKAQLFIVDLAMGTLIKTIDTGMGSALAPNGLATPIAVDSDADRSADIIYAGDLHGNMWRFDVAADNTNSWVIPYKITGKEAPLFTAIGPDGFVQPITAKPQVGLAAGGALMVFFGTGQYLGTGDVSSIKVQSFYGIKDAGAPVSGRDQLLRQEIIHEATHAFDSFNYDVRLVTDAQISSSHNGWYLDLLKPVNIMQGERVVSAPLLWSDRIIFATMIPDPDPCSHGGTSWLMELDPTDGSRLDFSPFDLNHDGLFNESDYIIDPVTGEKVPVSGRKSKEGIIKTPGVIHADDESFKYTSGSTGNIEVTSNKGSSGTGRQSWQQLR